jgi:hypothetical protein
MDWACPHILQSTRLTYFSNRYRNLIIQRLIFQWPQDRSCSYSIFELGYDQENDFMHSPPHSYVFGLIFCTWLQTSAVSVSEIIFTNITGSSATTTGVDIECSDSVPCRNVVLQNINLRSDSGPKIPAYSTCRNVYGFTSHLNNSMSCALLSHPIADYNYQPWHDQEESRKACRSDFVLTFAWCKTSSTSHLLIGSYRCK